MRYRTFLAAVGLVAAAGIGGAAALAYRPAIPAVAPPPRSAFAPDAIVRGAQIAAVGDCAVCHTARGGRPFAGGLGLATPFGTIYVSNITPDPETGIGGWSQAAFRRAMREGIDRDGRHLYPALPYNHFTRMADADIDAVYAFLMTRAPVQATTPPNRLPFPVNVRATLAGWNLLFLSPGAWQPDPAKPAAWNRGAYLVEAVGHCGACHTPRNLLGGEERGRTLGGGEAEGWYAPPLDASSPAPRAWTEEALFAYFRTGMDAGHGAAAGPMGPVTHALATVPEADVRAMATYIASLMPPSQGETTAPVPRPVEDAAGAAVFAGACASCHGGDAPMARRGAPPLMLGTAVNAPTPRAAIQVVLNGLPWREGTPAPYMPGFAASLSDAQVADLLGYLRARYSDRPAWTGVADEVRKIRQANDAS